MTSVDLAVKYPAASGENDDPDHDGLTNRDEWLAGTDPTLASSQLILETTARLSDLAASDKSRVPIGRRPIYFKSVPGRYYGVQSATSISGPWTLQAVRVSATNTTQTRLLVVEPSTNAFYRIVVNP